MPLLEELRRRFVFLFRRRQFESDLEEEMRFHLEMKAAEIGAAGARRQFGNAALLREESRAAWGWAAVDAFFLDLKYAARMLRKDPAVSAAAILTMALGIGGNTVMFSLVHAVLLRPLPYPDPARLVRAGRPIARIDGVNMVELEFWKQHCAAAISLSGYHGLSPHGLNLAGRTETIQAMEVGLDFLRTLGTAPALGREFRPEETRTRAPRAVILSDGVWRKLFAADSALLGRQIAIDDAPYTVVGVLPAGFWFEDAPDALLPLRSSGTIADLGTNTQMIARLKPGVTLGQASAEFAALSEDYRRAGGGQKDYHPLHAQSYQEWLLGYVRGTLWLLFGASALLLLIACTNLAGLLLARMAARQKEIAMRMALGSGMRRILRQFLAENLLLSACGGGAGLAAGWWLLDGFVKLVPLRLPLPAPVRVDLPVLAFTAGVVVGMTLLFSLAPFATAGRLNVNETLKSSGRSASGSTRSRSRSLLVAGETALSVTLLVAATLMIQSLYRLHEERLGFDPHGVTTFFTPATREQRRNPALLDAFNRTLLERLRFTPGVRAAAGVSLLPLTAQGNFPVEHAGHPDHDFGGMEIRYVTAGYFETMRTPIVTGRAPGQRDTESSPPVVVVNETVARAWWPGGNPLGDRIVIGWMQGKPIGNENPEKPREVVGVVADAKTVKLKASPRPTIYVPVVQTPWYDNPMNWVVRGSVTREALQKAVSAASPAARLERVRSMDEIVASTISDSRFYAWLFGAFASVALVLTAIGIYGLLAFSVARRTGEIGTRIALGATRANVLALVLKQGVALTAAGLLAGLGGALVLTRSLRSLLFGVRPINATNLLAVSILLIAVGLMASYLPARRATRIDPIEALRSE